MDDKKFSGNVRLDEVMRDVGVDSLYRFAQILRVSRQILYDIKKGRTKGISNLLADRIVQVYPQYSFDWLAYGVGDKVVADEANQASKPAQAQIKYLRGDATDDNSLSGSEILDIVVSEVGANSLKEFADMIKLSCVQILYDVRSGRTRRLSRALAKRIATAYPQYSQKWLAFGVGDKYRKGNSRPEKAFFSPMPEPDQTSCDSPNLVPLFSLTHLGTPFADFLSSCGTIPHEDVISPSDGAELALGAIGDGMEPRYPAGCRLYLRRVDAKIFIEWGTPYVLDTANGLIFRCLEKSKKGGTFVRCVAMNDKYAPFDLDLDNGVFGVWKVLSALV